MKKLLISTILLLGIALTGVAGLGVVTCVETPVTLGAGEDLHITATGDAVTGEGCIDMADPGCRLYFDNIRPSDILNNYIGRITVGGAKAEPGVNVRLSVYRHGTEVLPHAPGYAALTAFGSYSCTGTSETFATGPHYTNAPSADVRRENARALGMDNAMHSFTLSRGYMATLATEPDGTGTSICFIADDSDLTVDRLPASLDGKVSFVRVFPWHKPSKKGWVGGNGHPAPSEGFLDEQADLTGSTWAYNWGTSADWGRSPQAKGRAWVNQEFVPEKWGRGGRRDWQRLANDTTFTHLLSYNEPDHKEQSNITVEQAIEEWPRHLSTGLRLGSPATTDFRWLYSFIDSCDSLGYRVDFVAIHAYWGGPGGALEVKSVDDWYSHLRKVHERTGRPIWITEWNNGANWTREPWPDDSSARTEKQRAFMADVLAMMDTCDFIERYSVYNWVEEKRALFWGDRELTPAGRVYTDFKASRAYSPRLAGTHAATTLLSFINSK